MLGKARNVLIKLIYLQENYKINIHIQLILSIEICETVLFITVLWYALIHKSRYAKKQKAPLSLTQPLVLLKGLSSLLTPPPPPPVNTTHLLYCIGFVEHPHGIILVLDGLEPLVIIPKIGILPIRQFSILVIDVSCLVWTVHIHEFTAEWYMKEEVREMRGDRPVWDMPLYNNYWGRTYTPINDDSRRRKGLMYWHLTCRPHSPISCPSPNHPE